MIITNQIVIELARKYGFELAGFAKAEKLAKEIENLENWLGKNYQAGMAYMERNIDKREDVSKILPEAKSVISLGYNYYQNTDYELKPFEGKISRYAFGRDYHFVLWEKLDQLIAEIKSYDPTFEAKSYVDTGPVMDKAWAVRAGLGWLGKHTNVINRNIGSWFFISNIITNIDFEYVTPIPDYCGNCTACIDACPTDAIVMEYQVDANLCISYQTIENKGEIDPKLKGKFDDWIFGCDICQDVCPWSNKFSIETLDKNFTQNVTKKLSNQEIEEFTNSTFKKRFFESPLLRSKTKGIKRNAEFLFGEES